MWDLRNEEVLYTLAGHNDTITSLGLSANGHYVASNGMDNTGNSLLLYDNNYFIQFIAAVRIWDVRPFTQDQRQLKVLYGAQHNFEKVEREREREGEGEGGSKGGPIH